MKTKTELVSSSKACGKFKIKDSLENAASLNFRCVHFVYTLSLYFSENATMVNILINFKIPLTINL